MQAGVRSGVDVRIVTAAEVGDPARLQSLAERIFGRRDRAPNWFTRKLTRECVRPELSVVAIAAGASVTEPSAWCGYVLVGTPKSMPGVARTAGTGVVAELRGSGVGAQLIEAACQRAAAANLQRVRILAAIETAPFYDRLGFRPVRETSTLVAFARGPASWLAGTAMAWTPPGVTIGTTHTETCAWFREAWEHTPSDHRVSVVRAHADHEVIVHLSSEGTGWLVHRALTPVGDSVLAAERVLDELPDGAPVMATGIDPAGGIAKKLLDLGWAEAQRGRIVERSP